MREINRGFAGIGQYGSNFTLSMGVVKDNADPGQVGRLKVFVPAIDSKDFDVDNLPWATYCSPFGGTTANFVVGRENDQVPGASTYGFWAIPKNGAQVLVGFLEGDPNVRFWMGCFFQPELNRTLPQSINDPPLSSEIDESGVWPQAEIPHYATNLKEAGLDASSLHWKTRGGFERSVSHPSNKNRSKPTNDGYYSKPLEKSKSDSQTISLTSPGRHYLSFHDVDTYCRMRFKTTAGSQVIFDDTNERIYISTARGRNWVEIDEGSGKIYFYTSSKFSIHSENDLNLYSGSNINIVAKKRVNIQSQSRGVKIQGNNNVEILSNGGSVKVTASRDIHLKTLNGSKAGAVSESLSCVKPPYAGAPLGLNRDHGEEGGSGTSRIYLNGAEGLDLRGDNGPIKVTSNGSLDLRSISGSINLQGSTVGIKANVFATSVASFGFKAVDVDHGVRQLLPIESSNNASAADVAKSAAATSTEDVTSKMIIPKHEPWIRDEDEESCPTPRNVNYQG